MTDLPPKPNRSVVPDHSKRDRQITLLVGVIALMVFFFLILRLSDGNRGLTAIITEKVFLKQPEVQITVGDQGLKKKELAGEYRFIVKDPKTGRIYTIMVDPVIFDSKNVGDPYYFVQPK